MSIKAYSNLKPAWHLDKITSLRRGDVIAPAQIHFIISDLCNHDCHFCAYRMSGGFSTELFAGDKGEKNPKRMITEDKAIDLLDDFHEVGVKAVQFTGGGEPTVHPGHMAIFGRALDLGLECALVTNGSLLRDGWRGVLPRFKWIRVSVDAGNAEDYASIRRIKESQFQKVLDNICSLNEEIDKQGADCLLGAGYVVTNENWENLGEGIRLLKETGVPYVRLSAMFSEEGSSYYNGKYDAIKQSIREATEAHQDENFRVVNLFGDRIADLDQGKPDYGFCGYQQMVVYIGADLNVYRCCTTSYTKHGLIGNLKDQSFSDWLTSDPRRDLIDNFDARSCHHCQFNEKNKVINYMIDGDPTHVNFV